MLRSGQNSTVQMECGISKEAIYFADGSPMYFYKYDYDAVGNRIRETIFDTDGILPNTGRFEYRYDEYGNVLEQRRYLDGKFTGITKYDYIQVQVHVPISDEL